MAQAHGYGRAAHFQPNTTRRNDSSDVLGARVPDRPIRVVAGDGRRRLPVDEHGDISCGRGSRSAVVLDAELQRFTTSLVGVQLREQRVQAGPVRLIVLGLHDQSLDLASGTVVDAHGGYAVLALTEAFTEAA